MFLKWRLRRAWERTNRAIAVIEAATAGMSRVEKRQMRRDLVAGRPLPDAVLNAAKGARGRG